MKIFYDVIGGFHNVSSEYLPCSITVEIRTNGGKQLSRGDLFLPIIWGNPNIIYTLFSPSHGTTNYYDWYSEVSSFLNNVLEQAYIKLEEDGLEETESSLITWLEPTWIPPHFKNVNNHCIAYTIQRNLTPLAEYAKECSHIMESADTDGRVDFLIKTYYESLKRIG